MSLSQLRSSLFKTFEFMRDTSSSIDVSHRRRIYRVTIEDTGQKVTTPYKRKRLTGMNPLLIDTSPCSHCNSLLVNGVCMSRDCPSNQNAINSSS